MMLTLARLPILYNSWLTYEQANNAGIGANFLLTPLSDKTMIFPPSSIAFEACLTKCKSARSNSFNPLSTSYKIEIVVTTKSGFWV